jgi:hypothetical protein
LNQQPSLGLGKEWEKEKFGAWNILPANREGTKVQEDPYRVRNAYEGESVLAGYDLARTAALISLTETAIEVS